MTAVSSTADKICTKPASVQPAATGEIPGNLNRTPVSDGYMPHKYIPTFAIEKFGSRLLSGRFSLILCVERVASALHLDIFHKRALGPFGFCAVLVHSGCVLG